MDCFKLRPGVSEVFILTQREYLQRTLKSAPYCLPNKRGEDSFYAVCPECDNPVQIVGLFRDTIEAGKKPYGRHNKGDIPGLAQYCEEDYLNCSYSDPSWKRPTAKRGMNSKIAKEVLRLMYEQFDRVIYVLSTDIDIRISKPLARKMLQKFMDDKAWLYRMTTLNNLPWVLGETMPSTPLYGQWILQGSKLHQALEAFCPAAQFNGTLSDKYVQLCHKEGMYLDVRFFFLCHGKKLDAAGEHLEEYIDFAVSDGKKIIYQKTVPIRIDFFLKLIHLPDLRAQRNEGYLEIAHTLIDKSLFE